MNQPAVVCESLSKHFKLSDGTAFKALRNINFTLLQGSFTGIVGKNGCGKSTLLKILASITKPTAGVVKINGKVLSILEVGTGFHPDMTGIENIILVGTLFGLSNREIELLVPDILSFSEIDEYKGQPVKHYSQGMYLRLAMSLLFHLKADIYLFDEVVAVGDEVFQKKCFYKIKELAATGSTFVLVSHKYDEIAALCDRCLVLSEGELIADANPELVYEKFVESLKGKKENAEGTLSFKTILNGYLEMESFAVKARNSSNENKLTQADELEFIIKWKKLNNKSSVCFHVDILDDMGRLLISTANIYGEDKVILEKQSEQEAGSKVESCVIPSYFLNTGKYLANLKATIYFNLNHYELALESETPLAFEIHNSYDPDMKKFWTFSPSPIRTAFSWVRSR